MSAKTSTRTILLVGFTIADAIPFATETKTGFSGSVLYSEILPSLS